MEEIEVGAPQKHSPLYNDNNGRVSRDGIGADLRGSYSWPKKVRSFGIGPPELTQNHQFGSTVIKNTQNGGSETIWGRWCVSDAFDGPLAAVAFDLLPSSLPHDDEKEWKVPS